MGGGSGGDLGLPAGLPAADALSPFHSGGPSPLALLQALQAEAGGPDGADAGAASSLASVSLSTATHTCVDCTCVSFRTAPHTYVYAGSSHCP
jgi:hypothetical protein